MNSRQEDAGNTRPDFHELTPDHVIGTVEAALGLRLSSFCMSLSSYINRVYELRTDEGEAYVAKFYRPGRWSRAALEDEHSFVAELAQAELPVIAPLQLTHGNSLGCAGDMFYAVYPKRSGRPLDEPSHEQWTVLGRLLGRAHQIGAQRPAAARLTLSPQQSCRQHIDDILQADVIPRDLRTPYADTCAALIENIEPLFKHVTPIRIHGDCHQGNIVDRLDGRLYLIDFDDMAMGPEVQDMWMLLPDNARKCMSEISAFAEGYETFRTFPRGQLPAIEALRAMRFVYFCAWCAMQQADGGFKRLAPDWGGKAFWEREISDIKSQIVEIDAGKEIFWGI